MRGFLLDGFSVFTLKRGKIIVAPENTGGLGRRVVVLEVGETPATLSNSQASKVYVVLIFVI